MAVYLNLIKSKKKQSYTAEKQKVLTKMNRPVMKTSYNRMTSPLDSAYLYDCPAIPDYLVRHISLNNK